jgi:hypothetical protein
MGLKPIWLSSLIFYRDFRLQSSISEPLRDILFGINPPGFAVVLLGNPIEDPRALFCLTTLFDGERRSYEARSEGLAPASG